MSTASPQTVTLALVGDVHEQWEADDATALQNLGVDLVLFVGDFGNESLTTIRQIAQLDLPKATIFGNHDAWYTATPWGRRKRPYDPAEDDRFQQQFELLQDCRVGYGYKSFPELGLAVVGSRPFSWGGPKWLNKTFYRDRFGTTNFENSSAKIAAAAMDAPESTLIMIGHNGPTGLGDAPEDICGKDWKPPSIDYGDPDLAMAIAQIKAQGKSIPLVGFGHMHHALRHRGDRLRTSLVTQDSTVYLNAARCPRIVERPEGTLRNFSRVTLVEGQVDRAELIWVSTDGTVVEQELLYAASEGVIGGAIAEPKVSP